jgi:hypothetical protein
MRFNSEYGLWMISIISLLLGIIFYIVCREPILVSLWLGIEEYHIHNYISWLNWFPSFVHQFSFVLLSWLALGKEYKWFVIFLWFCINTLFELGQAMPNEYANYFPKVLADYFSHGTYSHGDMLAILLATVVAYMVINKYEKRI